MMLQHCPKCGTKFRAGDQACMQCGFVFPFATDMLAEGRVLQGRYEVIKLIHSGGMGYIYLAMDRNLEREVVVKQVRQAIKSKAHRGKLEEEALKMAAISHPGVAMVFDHFVEDDFYFLVVEYIQGKTLAEIYEENHGSLTENQVVTWMAQVCDVIGHLHQLGMVHRDISPDNIMLTDEVRVKLIDFGTLHDLSLIVDKKAGKEGKFGFTPKEQWDGQPVPQSDVFALGATTYYLLTGYLPLSERYKQGGKPEPEDYAPVFPPIREMRPDISEELEQLLNKALVFEIAERLVDASQMHNALLCLTAYPDIQVLNIGSYSDTEHGVTDNKTGSKRKWAVPVIGGITGIVLIGFGVWSSGVLIPPPKLEVDNTTISFKELAIRNTSQRITRTAKNIGGKPLSGEVTTDAIWLNINAGKIDIASGESKDFDIWANTYEMPLGASGTANVMIKTNGGEAKIPVNVTVTNVIFNDDFSRPDNGWFTTSSLSAVEYNYKQGGFSIKVKEAGTGWVTRNDTLGQIGDCTVEVDVKWLTSESVNKGIYMLNFHRADKDNEYVYGVNSNDGTYSIGKYVSGKFTSLKDWTLHKAIGKGTAVNRMKITSQGNNFKFYVNNELLTSITDSAFTKGYIVPGVSRDKYTYSDVEVFFDNFKVTAVSSPKWDAETKQWK